MTNNISIELCCGSLEDCMLAERVGADRIELITAHLMGGLTPSAGLLRRVKETVSLPVSAIVRPRGAGFNYSDEDFSVMCADAKLFSELGADGIVCGFLDENGELDYERCARFLDYTGDCEKVFHRAIDVVRDMPRTVEKLISLGFTRVLTSGGKADAFEGAAAIAELQRLYGDRIQILAGAGVRAKNVSELIRLTKVTRVHLGGTSYRADSSTQANNELNFGTSTLPPNECYIAVDESTIREVICAISERSK